jgi:hypothetical protein
LPRLGQRVKIDLRRRCVDVFDHARTGDVQVLYLKSRILPADHPDRVRQLAFDRALMATQLFDFRRYGPSFATFAQTLQRHQRSIRGYRLVQHRQGQAPE